MADISHLRKMSGAGMMDCKKALEEAGNDFDKAMELSVKKVRLLPQNVQIAKLMKVVYWQPKTLYLLQL